VLVHEVISSESLEGRTPAWQAYHRAYHTPGYELGDIATKARPKLLVLYHQLPSGIADSTLLQEVHRRYKGIVVSGKDLGVY
jgi:ribonuclease BN (tRNA processing enzyme)